MGGRIPMEVGRKWRFVKTTRYVIWSTIGIVGGQPIFGKHGQGQTQILELHEIVTCKTNLHHKPSFDVIPLVFYCSLGWV